MSKTLYLTRTSAYRPLLVDIEIYETLDDLVAEKKDEWVIVYEWQTGPSTAPYKLKRIKIKEIRAIMNRLGIPLYKEKV